MEHTHANQIPGIAPLLRIHREEEPETALRCDEERERRQELTAAEEFWAGRNRATRQSARVAA